MRGRHLGHDGARQRLVDGVVERLVGRQAAVLLEVLADAVEHDDRVVQRVADDREDGRDHREIELGLRDREHAEHQDRVVHHGEDGAQRQPPGMKAQDDVEADQDQRDAPATRWPLTATRRRPAGPTTSSVVIFTPGSILPSRPARTSAAAARRSARWTAATMLASRVPVWLTCGSWKPPSITALRTASISTGFGKLASTEMPPVKSIAKLSPLHEERRERHRASARSTARTTPCGWP